MRIDSGLMASFMTGSESAVSVPKWPMSFCESPQPVEHPSSKTNLNSFSSTTLVR